VSDTLATPDPRQLLGLPVNQSLAQGTRLSRLLRQIPSLDLQTIRSVQARMHHYPEEFHLVVLENHLAFMSFCLL